MADFDKLHGSVNPKDDAEWFTYMDTDAKFLIAPAENPGFNIAALKSIKMDDQEDPDQSVYDAQIPNLKIITQYILLGWENVCLKGKIVEYSPDRAALFMCEYPMVAKFITNTSEELKELKFGEQTEELKKKSKE